MNFTEKAEAEIRSLHLQIRELSSQIAILPEGYLKCNINGQSFKCFQCLEPRRGSKREKRIYLKSKDTELKKALALKTLLMVQRDACLKEIEALQNYQKQHIDLEKITVEFHGRPGFHSLLPEHSAGLNENRIIPGKDHLTFSQWMSMSYDKNPYKPENLIIDTDAGIKVRSKSEAYILNKLYANGIPFHYDCAVYLRNIRFYADFHILHPQTGAEYYWEHFGMIDNPEYLNDMSKKLRAYIESGYVPTQNLIVTFESRNSPLSYNLVDEIIAYLFL